METLKFLIATRLKQVKVSQSSDGFTLIEILVALLIAFFVITPLLGLAVNLLDTDRREQAKATSEQEIQAAADFIARDLQQAVFIYDPVKGLTRNRSTTSADSGIKDQIPPNTGDISGCKSSNCVPVLAFWKRRRVTDAIARDSASGGGVNCNEPSNAANCDDTFVYSLVTYYLIKDDSSTDPWSSAARIGRFEITDGVKNLKGDYEASGRSRKERRPGFKMFDLNLGGATVAEKMNQWERANETYSANDMQIVVDYIDRTEVDNGQSEKKFQTCPVDLDSNQVNRWTITKPDTTPKPSPGFYVCVNTEKNIARVFLRGNAWARITPIRSGNPDYSNDALKKLSSYFPTATAEVRGIGGLRE
ncbi:hormogonium polysaccharide secretion pseudopilin HpsC [Oscillatoria sp. FACHB-1406]|uniref:hormogonium polysaccharide secretion pseudopilin HpsC n=1 Tax=Oscillatoria sp. FACHB-1406 TaxID=2692846 RepID=UPI0016894095|nr:hormogonium polysaccharide secretion pseudopilin HpsC [Oscillatoria sp. FACHB-1406]MBD2577102.1 prepilin-type N-terminal cleavage/methylation domain-containing protein [Oscillatoria sp. FACHB-1406]